MPVTALENDPSDQLKRARVAGEEVVDISEAGRARDQEVTADGRCRKGLNVGKVAAGELRVIQQIEELRAEIQVDALGETDLLHERGVDVVGPAERERIAAAIGLRTQAGHDVPGIGIVRHVGNDTGITRGYRLAGRVERGDAAAD